MTDFATHSIPNLFTVEQAAPAVFRGGQPGPVGWQWLCGEGVRTVIKLNTESEGSDAGAESLGMTVHRFPVPWWRQTFWRPSQADLITAVGLVVNRTDPVFVHCTHGQDRTGLMIGCFRLAQGWSKADAETEMDAHGFHEVALQGLEGRWNTEQPEDWVNAFSR